MKSLYTISGKLLKNYNQLYFFSKNKYNYKLTEVLRNHNQAFCYKLYIPKIYITENFNDQQEGKILKINHRNAGNFQCFNYSERYIDNINYDCPYPLYYPCSKLLINNFDGIDATDYIKIDNHESFWEEGLIWNVKDQIKLELIDRVYRLPSDPF